MSATSFCRFGQLRCRRELLGSPHDLGGRQFNSTDQTLADDLGHINDLRAKP
jgi:hypothetical protein